MEAMFYALAIKFLDKTELRKVKEKINMTLLGQMLMEDGIEKGEMTKLVSLVMKKMKKGLSPEETAELLEESPGYFISYNNPGFLFLLSLHRHHKPFPVILHIIPVPVLSGWAYRTSQHLIPNRLAVSLVYMSMVISAGYPMS